MPAIATYVKQNHKGSRIIGIEKKRNGYEIELSNDLDLEFDKQGNFIRFDD
ncbi:PepSY-like domain-containing protein [uncultured Duncaniella sp.]|uniref:PepSY-like domain-containing protein n=1 Tax=uncultured Duncaniella sp. TaxID=2768039 RepID=UPI00350E3698